MATDSRLDFAATRRNRQAICDVLTPMLEGHPGQLLEIASGSGQHGVFIADALPQLVWWPTDIDPAHMASIEAWRRHAGNASVKPVSRLDVTQTDWRAGGAMFGWPEKFDAIVNINMIHIAPWPAALGLFEGAARRLGGGGFLYLYGPFQRDGAHTAPSNEAFHRSLMDRNPAWGVRDIGDVCAAANAVGLTLAREVAMPANNLSLIFRSALKPSFN